MLQEVNSTLNERERLPLPLLLSEVQAGANTDIWLTEREYHPERSKHYARQDDRDQRLKALLADHSGFMRDRLKSFIGRQAELKEIRKQIADLLQTGGYLTITGQAGQGKSSVIAKLVEEHGIEQIAFHFIPLNPGPDHQVGLLRNLMARLILKYHLSDLYVASDSRAALRDYLPRVLAEVAAKGGQEVIFLDGLDQLEEDFNGVRDLSFLPTNPPPGIVFVLGTRPNDTLRPLQLLKPHREYLLPNLSREDFDVLLQRRKVSLPRRIADQFYQAMQENALYLDLVTRELQENSATSPQEMITRIADNPENIFSLSIARLKRQPVEWREVIKPVLGVLLAAREALSHWQIRTILSVEDDRLRDALSRLGGLVVDIGEWHYSLYHLKLQEYLQQDEQRPHKEYVFATDEVEHWHAVLTGWCEQERLELIWQDVPDARGQSKRKYARRYYITHLYFACKWQRLFAILDEGSFGRAKEQYDLSTRSYVQDLDLGRRAATWSNWTREEKLVLLSHLWRYTWLRCSLRCRADQYPMELFKLLLLLGEEQKVLGLAELLTNGWHKYQVFLLIAKRLAEFPERKAESTQFFLRNVFGMSLKRWHMP